MTEFAEILHVATRFRYQLKSICLYVSTLNDYPCDISTDLLLWIAVLIISCEFNIKMVTPTEGSGQDVKFALNGIVDFMWVLHVIYTFS